MQAAAASLSRPSAPGKASAPAVPEIETGGQAGAGWGAWEGEGEGPPRLGLRLGLGLGLCRAHKGRGQGIGVCQLADWRPAPEERQHNPPGWLQ